MLLKSLNSANEYFKTTSHAEIKRIANNVADDVRQCGDDIGATGWRNVSQLLLLHARRDVSRCLATD